MRDAMPINGLPPLLLKASLGPVLLLQGLWVRMRTPRLPEAAGPRRGRTGSGPGLRLLVLGDSSAAGVGVASQSEALLGQLTQALGRFYTVDYRLEARTGATTAEAIDTLTRRGWGTFDAVVTALGVNDLTAGRKPAAWRADKKRLIDSLRARLNPRIILLSGLPPVHLFPALPQPLRWYLGTGARAYNVSLEALARANDALFLPLDFSLDIALMAADGFHPGRGIYREWGRRAADRLRGGLTAETPDAPGGSGNAHHPRQIHASPPAADANPGSAPARNLNPRKECDPCTDC